MEKMRWRFTAEETKEFYKWMWPFFLVIGLPIFGFIIYVNIKGNRIIENSVLVTRETEVRRTRIPERGGMGPGRGGIYFANMDSVIDMGARLIGDIQRVELWQRIYKSKPHYRYSLGDLNPPYEFSKKANNDTVVVNKDGCELKFLLIDYDSGPEDE